MQDRDKYANNILSGPVLEPVRKVPSQSRSKQTVRILIDVAHDILAERGRKCLTTTSLEAVSGIARSSIYQYFPNLDSLVAEVFLDVVKKCQITGFQYLRAKEKTTVLELTTWMIDWALDAHRQLIKLDQEFYVSYSGLFDLWAELDFNLGSSTSTLQFLTEQLDKCIDFDPAEHDPITIEAFGRTAQLMPYSLLKNNPQKIDNPSFRDLLIRISCASISHKI